ncbi:Type IV fimbrial assembly protein PilC [Gilliamella apicola]|uniref:protein transport protein HofC n=1 Tax=Gilliamella sp. wkB18 TaxID=3120260 RepID=UPI0004DD8DE2|nr:protein transport protein HofC [Gilliamella apicola]KFA59307.1 Type IV fimbrial assembly protein PilC [Gilliamella apicola]
MKRLYYWYDDDFCQHKIIARSRQEAKRQLLLQGKIVIRLNASIFISTSSFKHSELLIITKQMATMLKAGLPLIESLKLLSQDNPKPQWQYLLIEIEQQVAKGETLSKVLALHQSIFPKLYCEIIATGELTGQLDKSFEQLALQLERSIQLQKRIKSAMRYPLFLLSVSLIVMLVMLLCVLPRFVDIYESFDADLPVFTQFIINMSTYIQYNWFKSICIFIFTYVIYKYYLKANYQIKIDSWIIKLPILGKVIQVNHLTQIFQTVSITQFAGIPLLTGLHAAANTMHNTYYLNTVHQIIVEIEKGYSFSSVLKQQTLFPDLCSQLIHVGEESGTLDLMLQKLACYYQEQSQILIDNLSQTFEPLFMIILAVIIGSLIVAMYLPIFQLGDVIH